jgi:hypothetical protein
MGSAVPPEQYGPPPLTIYTDGNGVTVIVALLVIIRLQLVAAFTAITV